VKGIFALLSKKKIKRLQQGGVFVPSPLALDENKTPIESYQRLLTLYYIKSGATAVVPGAHTGEFAMNDLEIYRNWLRWVKEMTVDYGEKMILMAAAGGKNFMKQVELAAEFGYDLVMIAPTAFSGKSEKEVIGMIQTVAMIIPIFGFELQRAIPGAYSFSLQLWESLFEFSYGAKGASFDTYRSLVMLEAAARSPRKEFLTLLTGNDDRIVDDLMGEYAFETEGEKSVVQYHGGLLGHLATDTHAAVKWVQKILDNRKTGYWDFCLSEKALAHAVNRCNMALFDALGNFENSVWGVKYRLTSLGLLPAPNCFAETGRSGQAEAIDRVYREYPEITDHEFLRENLESFKKEVGIRNG
jgi:hypothetical protein